MELFEALADQVELLATEHSISDAAQLALQNFDVSKFSLEELVQQVLRAESLPNQSDEEASFGDPPVTVAHRDGFHIQCLVWRQGSPGIHHHAFSGAFAVLQGTSLHVQYAFEVDTEIEAGFCTGELATTHSEVLKEGDLRQIRAGAGFIHSVFHLENPSVSLVIRSHFDKEGFPQLAYTPTLAYNPFLSDSLSKRKLQWLRLAIASAPEKQEQSLRDFIETSSVSLGFAGLLQCVQKGGVIPSSSEALEALGRRAKCPPATLKAALDHSLRETNIVSRREVVVDPNHRLLLALLLTMPSRVALLDCVERLHPTGEAPHLLVMRWLGQLAGIAVEARLGSNPLGIRLDPPVLSFLSEILIGRSLAEAEEACGDLATAAVIGLTIPHVKILRPLFQ